MSDMNADGDYSTLFSMLKKIYIVGVLVDMIEEMCPSSTKNLINILLFKKNISSDDSFMKAWYETLGELLKEQRIFLEVLMSAEKNTERMKNMPTPPRPPRSCANPQR